MSEDVKYLEIRDRMTSIAVLAVKINGNDSWLARKAGFSPGVDYVLLSRLDNQANWDPSQWSNQRTMGTAHQHIVDHWKDISNEDVIDVEFILGEVSEPKESEREWYT